MRRPSEVADCFLVLNVCAAGGGEVGWGGEDLSFLLLFVSASGLYIESVSYILLVFSHTFIIVTFFLDEVHSL